MRLRQTHTYAMLEVSPETYRDIRTRLLAVDYSDAIHGRDAGEVLDMHGMALQAVPPAPDALPLDPVYLALQAAMEEQRETFVTGTTAARVAVLRGWLRLIDKHIAIVMAREEGP